MKIIEREEYQERLKKLKDNGRIKVIAGVRKCGKSTLMNMHRCYLTSCGIQDRQIITVDCTDTESGELFNYKRLYDHLKRNINENEPSYIFIDEIQVIRSYELALVDLLKIHKADIYITGSDSGILASSLPSGSYDLIRMFPLSFSECYDASMFDKMKTKSPAVNKLKIYLSSSTFPDVCRYSSDLTAVKEKLRDIVSVICFENAYNMKRSFNAESLIEIMRVVLEYLGDILPIQKINDMLVDNGIDISRKTTLKYTQFLTDSMVFYEVSRYSLERKCTVPGFSVFYTADLALRYVYLKNYTCDMSILVKNAIYLEFLRRGYKDIYVAQTQFGLIDFMLCGKESIALIQVVCTKEEEIEALKESSVLSKAPIVYTKYLFRLDDYTNTRIYGITKVDIIEWLTGERTQYETDHLSAGNA